MKLLLKALILSSGLCFIATSAEASNVTAKYKTWNKMKSEGWRSSDDFDDNKMHNALLWDGEVINQYPWTKYAFLRHSSGMPMFIADKTKKTLSYVSLKPRSGDLSDLNITYQGENNGKGCYVSIVDTGNILRFELESKFNPSGEKIPPINPEILMTLPENCIDKQQLSAIKARQSAEDKRMQQWVGEQTLKELCRQTGNC